MGDNQAINRGAKYEAVYFVGDNQAINRGAFSGSLAALLVMLPWKYANIALNQLLRRLNLRFRKVPILRKQQSADMRKSPSTWISGIK